MTFTTFALSLAFFEAVVLERLVRGGGRNALILSDPEGIRAGLREHGARGAGRDYELEPIACRTGSFHPKISVFSSTDDTHLVVGSGNLTFGGWGANLEVFEHLHPSFAADAFEDAADFFDLLAIDDKIRLGAPEKLSLVATDLRRAAVGSERSGNFRLLHSVGGSVADQIVDLADGLGGAQRLTVISPYFDTAGTAVARLSSELRCPETHLHVHPGGTVRGAVGANWPLSTKASASLVPEPFGADDRLLHAKCFEIICRRGRLIVSGSANATRAALENGNVEAVIARVQRETTLGWALSPASPPAQISASEEAEEEAELKAGVLTATLDGDVVRGMIITSSLPGPASMEVLSPLGHFDLGLVQIDVLGRFSAEVPTLEGLTWVGGRTVLRVTQGTRITEGFVSVAAALAIVRRAGAIATRIFAMLAGTETPEDVAAVLSWFHEHPEHLLSSLSARYDSTEQPHDPPDVLLTAEILQGEMEGTSAPGTTGQGDNRAWERAMASLRSAFATPRAPWDDDQDDQPEEGDPPDDEEERRKKAEKREAAEHSAMDAFFALLDQMLADEHDGRYAQTAFAMGQFLIGRTRPSAPSVRTWLPRVVGNFRTLDAESDNAVIATAMLMRATDGRDHPVERARQFLLDHQIMPEQFTIDDDQIVGLVDVLAGSWNSSAFMDEVRAARTTGEQGRAFMLAVEMPGPLGNFPLLQQSPHWRRLLDCHQNENALARVLTVQGIPKACPKCHMTLDGKTEGDLRSYGVAMCCRLLVRVD